jgi:hypothetical protein
MQKFILISYCLFLFAHTTGYCQTDTTINDSIKVKSPYHCKSNLKQLIIPSVLITYGVIGLRDKQVKSWNEDIRGSLKKSGTKEVEFDNYSQYVPALSVYALNALGVKGKHNFRDRTIILSTSMLLTLISVKSIKNGTSEMRPDETDKKSFPSGHTALAFAGAEFLYQEYKDVSVWYGVAGYALATTTGLMRIYKDKHWFTDVAAGAGIGIFCTKTAYWLQPCINKLLFKSFGNDTKSTAFASPFYDGKNLGGMFVINF